MARLLEKYKTEIIPGMMERFGYRNRLQVPSISKIVVSMGVGKALEDGTRLESAMRDLSIITGQKPRYTKAKKSVAGFKVREGNRVGCMVTLRRKPSMPQQSLRLGSLATHRAVRAGSD